MNRPSDPVAPAESGPADRTSALFVGLVLQQANLASAFLGLEPHPETGRAEVNLEAATHFIDTLEMLEAKTRGNLEAGEARFLADTLTSLRLAFVQAAGRQQASPAGSASPTPPPAGGSPADTTAQATPPPGQPPPREDEGGSGKRFVKRY